jgi:bacterioferritin
MAKDHESTNIKPLAVAERKPMVLDKTAIEAAGHSLDHGAVTPSYGPWRKEIIELPKN